MPLMQSLFVGSSGMQSANTGIGATSHNVANAMTEGFSRRSVAQSVQSPVRLGGLLVGGGVKTDGVLRSADMLLGMRRVREAGNAAMAQTSHATLSTVEGWFSEASGDGMRAHLDSFFDTLTEATADPSDPSLREAVVQAAGLLAREVSTVATGLARERDFVDQRAAGMIAPLNEQLQEVAELNRALVAEGGALTAGDLADRRDTIIRGLAESAGITAHYDADGQATLFVGGHAVVSGAEARTLTYDDATSRVLVSVDDGYVDVTSSAGGSLGGLLEARDALGRYEADLDTFAVDFSNAVNTQLNAGFDTSGNPGQDLFSATSAATFTVTATGDDLAFAGDAAATAGDSDNLTQLLALQTQTVVGGKDPGAYLTGVTSQIGNELSSMASMSQRQDAVLGDLDQLAESLHGVDLDEEAANLIMYQTAWQAAAKVVSVTDQMLAELVSLR